MVEVLGLLFVEAIQWNMNAVMSALVQLSSNKEFSKKNLSWCLLGVEDNKLATEYSTDWF